ncbi:MAG: hypothetical protein JJ885_04530 [Muricauda sp.]|nr:hypothetical protein [Allomuricauda sp.]MBO6590269.1 hypothetical protein [Allomuricauda sp.]MBO6619895.1 hypothetical protein [Allomuricauda sp.]MBO6645763.1 hypothetical protein [Allomuricauda sp.]MBO6748233.1 hypothetical protein [Allomuricauda sp.]MBO6843597.1 hypothetical protein [Allomuricauda sp.]
MNIDTIVDAIKASVERYISEDLSILWSEETNTQKWNNLDTDYIQILVEDTFDVLNKAIERNLLKELPFNYISSINTGLNNLNGQIQSIKGLQPAQLRNQHHQPLNQISGLNTSIRNSGLYSLVKLGPDIPETDKLIREQLTNINARKEDLDKLTKQVKTLLSPAVADRLSTAFSKRSRHIYRQKLSWLGLLLSSIVTAIYFTSNITETIAELIQATQVNEEIEYSKNFWIIWVLRLFILFPIYYLVFFSIKQYSRERKLEEVYAHKSAIAETLPSYPELLTEKSVGDEITSMAASVIFAPAEVEEETKNSQKNYKIEDLKELLDLASKMSTKVN